MGTDRVCFGTDGIPMSTDRVCVGTDGIPMGTDRVFVDIGYEWVQTGLVLA